MGEISRLIRKKIFLSLFFPRWSGLKREVLRYLTKEETIQLSLEKCFTWFTKGRKAF